MTTIYAVSRGSYSDYSVVALFSTEADAQLFMDRHPNGYTPWNDIEEYVLDCDVEKIREGLSLWWVQMLDDGTATGTESGTMHIGATPDAKLRSPTKMYGRAWFNWYGWAKDKRHAVKIANEHRIALLAQV